MTPTHPDVRDLEPEHPWAPGSWRPGALGIRDSVSMTVVLIIIALVRGFDYLTPRVPRTAGTSAIEDALPLWGWGLLFAAPAAVLTLGVAFRVHRLVWIGHGVLAVIYLAVMVGTTGEYLTHTWASGIKGGFGLILPAYLHFTIAWRTGWTPPR